MVGPWIHALWKRGRRLSDIEYLSIKEFDGKRVDVDDQQILATGTETDLATQTANAGKDMYLGVASINLEINGLATTYLIQLYADGTVVDAFRIQMPSTDADRHIFYTFPTKGIKVAATQIIKITTDASASNSTNYTTKLVLWEEATGDSPAV